MRRPRVCRVLGEGAIDLWAGGIALSVPRERRPVMGGEPPLVAVARGKPVQQLQQRALLPGAAGAADQAVGERVVASTTASRGQASRCARTAESAPSTLPAASNPKNATCLASRSDRPAVREAGDAIDARAAAASPPSSNACALAVRARAKRGSAAMARSSASIAPGYMVSFASQPST